VNLDTATFAAAFIVMFGGHHLADYPFQTDHQAGHKANKTARGWLANQVHAATHTGTTAVLLVLAAVVLSLPLTVAGTAASLAWIHLSHSAIDRRRGIAWWMDNTGQKEFRQHGGAAHVDQAAHIALGLIPAAALLAVL
jgi:hypothetical protein